MSTKLLERAQFKATLVEDQHAIDFYMLAFSEGPDRQGDRIDPGAADAWLERFYKSGFPLPISYTHAAVKTPQDPFAIIGYAPCDAQHVFKDEHGIRVRAFLDTGSNTTAQQVYTLTKRGIINAASVAYISEKELLQRDGSTLIQQMSILEAGPCLDPANPDAYIIAVKSLEDEDLRDRLMKAIERPEPEPETEPEIVPEPVSQATVTVPLEEWNRVVEGKAGRKIASANAAKLKAARDLLEEQRGLIDELIALSETSSPDLDGKANEEDPDGANLEEPSPNADLREAMAAAEA